MSTVNNKNISCREAVPIINVDIFSEHENQRFAMGIYRPEDIINYEPNSMSEAYLRLRANVYIDRAGILNDRHRRDDGTEIDDNDERSTHLIVFENRLLGMSAIFACMRLIEKSSSDRPLPIEELFTREFSVPAPDRSVEVSRLIVCHENARCAYDANRRLMISGLSYVLENELGPVFGVVEPGLAKGLGMMGVPISEVTEPRAVGGYPGENLGIRIDALGYKKHLGEKAVNNMTVESGSMKYWGVIPKDYYGKI